MNLNGLEQCIEEYGKDIYSFCLYTTGNKETADDLYQQTFLTAVEKGDLDISQNPKSYLIAIAVNLWRNQKRKYLWREKKAGMVYFGDEEFSKVASLEEAVEDSVVKRDEIERVRELVGKLPEKMKMVILLFYMEGLSIQEIANTLHIPPGTVKSRMNQAKSRLKEGMSLYE